MTPNQKISLPYLALSPMMKPNYSLGTIPYPTVLTYILLPKILKCKCIFSSLSFIRLHTAMVEAYRRTIQYVWFFVLKTFRSMQTSWVFCWKDRPHSSSLSTYIRCKKRLSCRSVPRTERQPNFLRLVGIHNHTLSNRLT